MVSEGDTTITTMSEHMFRSEHPSWYDDRDEMLAAAKRQGLVR